MRKFILDLWYRLKSPLFWVAVLIGAIAFFLPLHGVYNYDVGLLEMYDETLVLGILTVIAPCIAVLPNIKRMIGFRGEIMKYEQMRCSNGKRMLIEANVSAISGGLALMLGPLLILLLWSIKHPMIGSIGLEFYPMEFNASFSNLLRDGHYVLFLSAKLSLLFLFGMSMNMIAFMLSAFIRDSFVMAFVPMMLQETVAIWFSRFTWYCNARAYLHGTLSMLPFDNTIGFWMRIFMIHCSIWLLCWTIANIRMNRGLQYE